jgi:hypothetical protein
MNLITVASINRLVTSLRAVSVSRGINKFIISPTLANPSRVIVMFNTAGEVTITITHDAKAACACKLS